jgi:mono/diheme cytochrome c family protein
MKTFQKNGRMIETRFLAKHADGDPANGKTGWSAWSYEWNEDQTDATRVDYEKTVEVEGIDWTFPDRGGCMHCHTNAAGVALGTKTYQMNGGAYYHSSDTWADQLNTLNELDIFTFDILTEIPDLTRFPRLDEKDASLNRRARAFLHSNCSGCHQPGAGGYGPADYRWDIPLENTNACDQKPAGTQLGRFDINLITPGDPENSMIYRRLSRTDDYSMHPYRSTVDEEGRQLIYQWIESLDGCTDPDNPSN